MTVPTDQTWPTIRSIGLDGFSISFGDTLSEPANRAALAFRAALDAAGWPEVEESATSLVSAYLRFDPLRTDHASMRTKLSALLSGRNWYDAALPSGRKRWRVPTVFGGSHGPQLEDAAAVAGLSIQDAINSIESSLVRVQTIGFAPGMPYLGELPSIWDIPRQTHLTEQVPAGGLCVALRQLVLFPVATPTGWRQIARTAVTLFQPEDAQPFLFRPGDEVLFQAVSADEFDSYRDDRLGGATWQEIA